MSRVEYQSVAKRFGEVVALRDFDLDVPDGAFLVMLGRVYVGAHNPLDVTAGLGAGMVIGGVLDVLLH